MHKLSIIHYQPISFYPPSMNLIHILEDKMDIEVLTTQPDKGPLCYKPFKAKLRSTKISKTSDNSVVRFLKYGWFVFFCLIRLILRRPRYVMYYESVSAMPVYLYKRYFNRKAKIVIHYHEYTTEQEYIHPGARLFNLNHKKERHWLYRHATWVSQTNETRLSFFVQDNPMIPSQARNILPNYPPRSWHLKRKEHIGEPVKCVYIGSLSLEDTFVEEFCRWVITQNGKITFDIFSFNFKEDTLKVINAFSSPYIRFHQEGVLYTDIPNLLADFDTGMLLYKAKSPNMAYNETNKLYEYLICGLDVWYPKEMTLLHSIDKSRFAPNIATMDFEDMSKFGYKCEKRIVDNRNYRLFAEDVYLSFFETITR